MKKLATLNCKTKSVLVVLIVLILCGFAVLGAYMVATSHTALPISENVPGNSEYYLGDTLTPYIDKDMGLITHTVTGFEMPTYRTDNGIWIEAIYDENVWKGKDNSTGVVYSVYREYTDDLGESVGIITVRDSQTNEITGVVEMNTRAVVEMINSRFANS